MSDKQFYINQKKTVDLIELAVDHWVLNVIESETAMKQIFSYINEMKKEEQKIMKGVNEDV